MTFHPHKQLLKATAVLVQPFTSFNGKSSPLFVSLLSGYSSINAPFKFDSIYKEWLTEKIIDNKDK
jgi:hypothetical protein